MPLRKDIQKVLVIGSGPIVIGQAAEFDYSGTQACLALKEEGIEVVLINSNPATIMTDETIADHIYIEPLTIESIEEIIRKEKPDGVIGTLGGQTGLNLAVQLEQQQILSKYGVELLGTTVDSIQKGEDREKFRQLMIDIGEPISESKIIRSYEEGVKFVQKIGYPVIIRPAYTLGGAGGGFAANDEELEEVLTKGLSLSPINQVLVERSIKGWKEIEYEVMRDANDTCITVCNMENVDPVGVHTGDSIVVAPSQTITDVQYQILRDASLKVIRALNVIGGCNIQFALDPHSDQYYIIEVNPRVSRSSALASKATGYPIARMAAKIAVGYHLDEIQNPITENTYASFEPAIDYIVVKLPRFPFDKFPEAERKLGTQMKATGEVMAIDRTFEGALNKGIRSLEMNVYGLYHPLFHHMSEEELASNIAEVTDLRLFAVAECFRRKFTIERVHELTQIDYWFLTKIHGLITLEHRLHTYEWEALPLELLREAKQKNMSDHYIAKLCNVTEQEVRAKRKEEGLTPGYKLVDTCAGEFEAVTPYYYSTWLGADEVEVTSKKKVLVIGSGPIRIGQGIEFDYCSVQATLALKKKGYEAVVMNNNPETVSTDYSVADRLYFEPLTTEDILHVAEKENVDGVLIQFGGQTAINVAESLEEEGIKLLGTSMASIDQLEDRQQFYDVLQKRNIPHIKGETVHNEQHLKQVANELGYPILVRPSYVIGGQSMHIFNQEEELNYYLQTISVGNEKLWPLLVDQYIPGLECEIDVICDGKDVVVPGIFEHVERAGVHSGDSVTIFPPQTMNKKTKDTLVDYAMRLSEELHIVGLMNIQFVIHEETVYVLEVNPRSSRTVPIMSKVTKVPMVEWATAVQLGDSLQTITNKSGLLDEPQFYTVKAPVFSTSKLKNVDHVLGPEMKSTGEVLGLGVTIKEAVAKALAKDQHLPFSSTEKHYVLCSINDRAKEESLATIQQFVQQGYKIMATPGTAAFLQKNNVPVQRVEKEKEQLHDIIREGKITAVMNVPTKGRDKTTFGFYIRELAVRYQVPYFTSLDTVKQLANISKENWEIRSMKQYTNATLLNI
ncbi:carbamoyl-phosphate synthase (glutamine-hydrolyzing) large subunit [Salirhabdus salicampi]|uniref:carbamoyl-phosphate synthase (glutamine-hydrolyzing) large subunit n=1 Tax=Salirhabdus salicampi TaxID=476102 RepID=UPI0020C3DCFC|nr:carbamoyl-phosphate synthase (glutamine-hydrolyzing) large subunit [Salirhabdus salicampi]MCP8617322.1 carbamoyl-phosphate synthase (glutamine-hydrolyzing) large subunit [Salirhabdus salicampi]